MTIPANGHYTCPRDALNVRDWFQGVKGLRLGRIPNRSDPLDILNGVFGEPRLFNDDVVPDCQPEVTLEFFLVSLVVEASIDLNHVHADIFFAQQATVDSVYVRVFVILREAEGVPKFCLDFHNVAIGVELDARGVEQAVADLNSLVFKIHHPFGDDRDRDVGGAEWLDSQIELCAFFCFQRVVQLGAYFEFEDSDV